MKRSFAFILVASLLCLLWMAGRNPAVNLCAFSSAPEQRRTAPASMIGPRFLKEWKDLLAQRGAQADGMIGFPSAEQLAATDVLIMYAQNAGDISPDQRANLDQFLKRGGGIVVIHDAIVRP